MELPENLEYGENLASTYSVEYNTQTEALNKTATPVVLSTGDGVVLNATIQDNLVDNVSYVDGYITYTVKVTNKGSIAANNVKVYMDIPEGLEYAQTDGGNYSTDETVKKAETEIGKIEAGNTRNSQNIFTCKK